MGFRLEPSEVARLLESVGVSASRGLDRATFAASQIDWRVLQVWSATRVLCVGVLASRGLDWATFAASQIDWRALQVWSATSAHGCCVCAPLGYRSWRVP